MFGSNEENQYQTGPSHQQSSVEEGNDLMVWGYMGWNGVGKLIEVQGKMDAEQYCEFLEEGVEESFETLEMTKDGCYFQQDNDPKHTSKGRSVVF